jgi:REP element-mobilizing transposase RayT
MPRGPRLDYPGALHHVIDRGIERRRVFRSDTDRRDFLSRLGELTIESGAGLYAWALLPNHFHLLLRTGSRPLSRLMQQLLGDYADLFNSRHRRSGHLFQNRFKSTLIDEESYLLEVLRYIHLNPVRSRLAVTLDQLDRYPWTGHATILGKREFAAQDVEFVLEQFGGNRRDARERYRQFVREGLRNGQSRDLSAGGLRRSMEGIELLASLKRGREGWAHDERILGTGAFVEQVLREEALRRTASAVEYRQVIGNLTRQISEYFQVTEAELRCRTLRRSAVDARAVFDHTLVRYHGFSLTVVGRYLNLSPQTVARGVRRGEVVLASRSLSPELFLPP